MGPTALHDAATDSPALISDNLMVRPRAAKTFMRADEVSLPAPVPAPVSAARIHAAQAAAGAQVSAAIPEPRRNRRRERAGLAAILPTRARARHRA